MASAEWPLDQHPETNTRLLDTCSTELSRLDRIALTGPPQPYRRVVFDHAAEIELRVHGGSALQNARRAGGRKDAVQNSARK